MFSSRKVFGLARRAPGADRLIVRQRAATGPGEGGGSGRSSLEEGVAWSPRGAPRTPAVCPLRPGPDAGRAARGGPPRGPGPPRCPCGILAVCQLVAVFTS